GFSVPAPDEAAAERLGLALPSASLAETRRNPVDLTLANLRAEAYRDTISALVDSPTYDAVVVVVGSSGLGDPRLAAEPVRAVAATPVEAEAFARGLDGPLVVKVLSRDIAHKSDVGGVRLGVPADDVARVCRELADRVASDFAVEGWLVQEQITGDATEMLL